ncbi:type II toxin-antitoxin system RatA family toxin [Microvirga sp. W0021]|uniref:Type II toxin-antitoxin system RatA family toxin n=1 Tax=Hohaiivirga grylli TaxID=3133970 RepID=A0ABV0BJR7_9HYPH
MPAFRTQKTVPHSAEEMFALVADVEHYPEFLPLCESINIKRRFKNDAELDVFISEMVVGYKAISECLTTRVTADKDNLHILVEYVDGPFRHLENHWRFKDEEGGCLVDFYITYEFKNFALGVLMGSVFDKAFRRFVTAFEDRADKLYSKRTKS